MTPIENESEKQLSNYRLSLGQAPLLAVKFRVRFSVRVRFGVMFRVLHAVQKVKQARLLVLLRLDSYVRVGDRPYPRQTQHRAIPCSVGSPGVDAGPSALHPYLAGINGFKKASAVCILVILSKTES